MQSLTCAKRKSLKGGGGAGREDKAQSTENMGVGEADIRQESMRGREGVWGLSAQS